MGVTMKEPKFKTLVTTSKYIHVITYRFLTSAEAPVVLVVLAEQGLDIRISRVGANVHVPSHCPGMPRAVSD